MENIPQPANEPYSQGDRVRVYLSDDDVDAIYHGLDCEVVGVDPDDLDTLTDRELDSNQYRLQRVDTDEELPIWFRHADVVPIEEWPKQE